MPMHCHFLFEGLNYTLKQLRSQLTKILVRPRLEAENKIYEYDKRNFINVCICVVQLVQYVQLQSNRGLIAIIVVC